MESLIHRVRGSAQRSSHILAAETVGTIAELSQLALTNEGRLRTPEFNRTEYLVNCDSAGDRITPTGLSIPDQLLSGNDAWIKRDGDTLLVSRWLAHFIGFRHRVIHLFLDHPDHPDCTFAQIRSLAKYNSPGRLDMPIGGHVTDLDDLETSLARELKEELGLDVDRDVNDLREVGTFNIVDDDDMPDHIEVEHATVYRATLKPDAFGQLRFQTDEVGALALFRIDELDRWIRERPEDVGGGMRDSWSYYTADETTEEV